MEQMKAGAGITEGLKATDQMKWIGLMNGVRNSVDVKYRRQGVAKELLEFMIADAKKRNLGKIELDVWKFNDSAIEFYQAAGFRQTRRWLEYEVE